MNRIVDISHAAAGLSSHLDNLVIDAGGEKERIPFGDIAALILSSPQVVLTQPALASLSRNNVAVVICGPNRLPCGMVLPLAAHYAQTQVFDKQSRLSLPAKKRVWRSLVKAKIRGQARVLIQVRGEDFGLERMAREVRSGDRTNVEGQAARRYWSGLFGPGFRRDFAAKGENGMLNYGYALLRGLVARALCASGLHPGLGVHHHHRFNPLPLADDFIEPFRPLVDSRVWRWFQDNEGPEELTGEAKAFLLTAFVERNETGGQYRTLFSGLNQMAASFVKVCRGEADDVSIPEVLSIPVERAGKERPR